VPRPSAASANGDLWSGFASEPTRGGLGDITAPAGSPATTLSIGMGLLGLALVALVASFGIAAVRRRKALVPVAGERPGR